MFVFGFGIGCHFYTHRNNEIKNLNCGFFKLHPYDKNISFLEAWNVESNIGHILVEKRCFVI